jgi:hypothetical protein
MTNKTCPVCGLKQAETATACGGCGWDFSPMLGTAEQTRALLAKRLEEARAAWRQRRYNPELVPELERDPFETPEEFAERLTERQWYVGEAELLKADYDIETGRFPLRFKSIQVWVGRWLNPTDIYYLYVQRDLARRIYQQSLIHPIYSVLTVQNGQVILDTLFVPSSDRDIRIEFAHATENKVSGRYRDIGDGTVLDTQTGLQWMRCAFGQIWNGTTCSGRARRLSWFHIFEELNEYNRKGGFAGYRDWRLPNLDELMSLMMYELKQKINLHEFPNTPEDHWFWSSSYYDSSSYGAWYVNFSKGRSDVFLEEHPGYARLVRGGVEPISDDSPMGSDLALFEQDEESSSFTESD